METTLADTGSPFNLDALVTAGWIEGMSNLGRGEPNELVVMIIIKIWSAGGLLEWSSFL